MNYAHSLVQVITEKEAINNGGVLIESPAYTRRYKFPNDPYIYNANYAGVMFWVTSSIQLNQKTILLLGTHGKSQVFTNNMVKVVTGPEKLE